MNRSLSGASIVLAACLLAGARPAGAGSQCVPSAWLSSAPSHLVVVGRAGANPDRALGEAVLVVRDNAGNPVPNSAVVLDFSDCPDVRIASETLDPGAASDCASRTWRGFTNPLGEAHITVLGGSTGTLSAGRSGVRAYADGVLFATIRVAVYDLDGSGGLSSADLAQWLDDYGAGSPRDRSDYNGNGSLDSSDLADWLTAYAAGGSAESAPSSCP